MNKHESRLRPVRGCECVACANKRAKIKLRRLRAAHEQPDCDVCICPSCRAAEMEIRP